MLHLARTLTSALRGVRTPSSSSTRALSAFCVAVLTVMAFAGQLAHWTLVSHELCAAHGELVHGDGEHDAHGASTQPQGAQNDHGASADQRRDALDQRSPAADNDAVGTSDDDDHDHCSTFVDPAERTAMAAPIGSPDVLAHAAPSTAPVTPVITTRRYLLAPKTSPPVAG